MSDPVSHLNAALAGRYRIGREAGEGGMATVYLADDLKHGRKVALKVLKPQLAAVVGAERFLAEIKTTASLHHPHILPLHDSGEVDSLLFYVMPYVQGESLRARLDREHQLPVDAAVRIATNMAEALDYAHRQGVIHRDIKPANVLLQDGKPVISDFGIALAVGAAGGGRLTETGLSLGTPYYMSPEQATGDGNVGPATDIYALGCVLYEMLVGGPPFTGSNAQAVLGAILASESPSAKGERASVPANVDAVIRRALERIPADRFVRAGQFATALSDASFAHGGIETHPGARRGHWNPLSAVLALVVVALITLLAWPEGRPVTPLPTVTPVSFSDEQYPSGVLAISPDGRLLVYEAENRPGSPLRAFRRDEGVSFPIPGTEGGRGSAIAPDGDVLAFIHETSIRVVAANGGVPRTVIDHPGACCLRWGDQARFIYFTEAGGTLSRVSVAGGDVEPVVAVDRDGGDRQNGWFAALPGGRHGFYQAAGPLDLDSRILLVELATGETREIARGKYPLVASGTLMFVTENLDALMALPLDERFVPAAPAHRIAEGLAAIGPEPFRMNPAPVAASAEGTLWYRTAPRTVKTPVWVGRDGRALPIDSTWTADYYSVALSPDGSRLLVDEGLGGCCIYVRELPGGPTTQITVPEATTVYRGSWTAEGDTVLFSGLFDNLGRSEVFMAASDGGGAPASLGLEAPHAVLSRDSRWIVWRTSNIAAGRGDLHARNRDGSQVLPLLATASMETQPSLSPDGRFMAYASDLSGQFEVYVRPFPDGNRWVRQVSTRGGSSPLWGRSGRELFYISEDEALVVATIDAESEFRITSRRELFSVTGYYMDFVNPTYDVSPDDERFVMLQFVDSAHVDQLIVVDDFFGLVAGN